MVRHNLPVVMIVGNNGMWGLEKHPMQMIYGWDVACDLQPGCRYDEVVRALGRRRRVGDRSRTDRPSVGSSVRLRRAIPRQRADRTQRRLSPHLEPRLTRVECLGAPRWAPNTPLGLSGVGSGADGAGCGDDPAVGGDVHQDRFLPDVAVCHHRRLADRAVGLQQGVRLDRRSRSSIAPGRKRRRCRCRSPPRPASARVAGIARGQGAERQHHDARCRPAAHPHALLSAQ